MSNANISKAIIGIFVGLVILYVLKQRGLIGAKSTTKPPVIVPETREVTDDPNSTDAEFINEKLLSAGGISANVSLEDQYGEVFGATGSTIKVGQKKCKCRFPNGWKYETLCDRGQKCSQCCQNTTFQTQND